MDIAQDGAVRDWAVIPGEMSGIPVWKWANGTVFVATRDRDQLLFLGAALAWFDEMSAEEFHAFVSGVATPRR